MDIEIHNEAAVLIVVITRLWFSFFQANVFLSAKTEKVYEWLSLSPPRMLCFNRHQFVSFFVCLQDYTNY